MAWRGCLGKIYRNVSGEPSGYDPLPDIQRPIHIEIKPAFVVVGLLKDAFVLIVVAVFEVGIILLSVCRAVHVLRRSICHPLSGTLSTPSSSMISKLNVEGRPCVGIRGACCYRPTPTRWRFSPKPKASNPPHSRLETMMRCWGWCEGDRPLKDREIKSGGGMVATRAI